MSFAGGFWATVELLVASDGSHLRPHEHDANEWFDHLSKKVKMQLKRNDDNDDNDDDDDDDDPGKVKVDKSTRKDNVDYGNLIDCR
jgi:hypothetical protein